MWEVIKNGSPSCVVRATSVFGKGTWKATFLKSRNTSDSSFKKNGFPLVEGKHNFGNKGFMANMESFELADLLTWYEWQKNITTSIRGLDSADTVHSSFEFYEGFCGLLSWRSLTSDDLVQKGLGWSAGYLTLWNGTQNHK